MVPVKLKGILSSSLCGLRTLLLCAPSYLSPSILSSIGCRSVTQWVNIPQSKRAVLFCSAILAATVKLLAGSGVYLYLYIVPFYVVFYYSLRLTFTKVVHISV